MKYIITDQGDVRIGGEHDFHREIARGAKGRVIAAGHVDIQVRTHGESIGYGIQAQQEDEDAILRAIVKAMSPKQPGNAHAV